MAERELAWSLAEMVMASPALRPARPLPPANPLPEINNSAA